MSCDNGPDDEALMTALEMNDRQASRAELRWYRFTSAYAVIIAGSLVLVQRGDIVTQSLLAGFILLLSIPGLITTLKGAIGYHYYVSYTLKTAGRLELHDWLAEPLYRHREPSLRTPFGMSRVPWFVVIYLVPMAAVPSWFSFVLTANPALGVAVFAVVFLFTSYSTWRYSSGMIDTIEHTVEVDEQFHIQRGG